MSRPVAIIVSHELGKAEARRRLEEGVDQFARQVMGSGLARVQHSWEGERLNFSARALGQGIAGRLDVLEDSIRIEVDLPNLLAGMADRIKGRLRREGQLLLEKK